MEKTYEEPLKNLAKATEKVANGDFSVSKFTCTVVRGTNNLSTVSRRQEDD